MPPDPDLDTELARFPKAVRALVDAEIAAGNAIVDVGHSHPAPPAGAYVKLARKVSTRPRASGGGLCFYERHSSLYSGEFTDERRFFWVLEPPDPPPAEPDMDAIRRAMEPAPDTLATVARRITSTWIDAPDVEPVAEGRTFHLAFVDPRAPHEVQWALEREIVTRFVRDAEADRLTWRAAASVNAAHWQFRLRFDAAMPNGHHYSLQGDVSWAHLAREHHDYERRSSASRFALWTRDLQPVSALASDRGDRARYEALCGDAIAAETRLDSVAAVQQAILAGVKRGGRYTRSHKEGGTTITWRAGRFVRDDYGDDPAHASWTDDAAFLAMLWTFCRWDVTRHAGDGDRSDLDTWTLILRLLRPA